MAAAGQNDLVRVRQDVQQLRLLPGRDSAVLVAGQDQVLAPRIADRIFEGLLKQIK